MDLHIGCETVEPHALKRIDSADEKARKAGVAPKAMLEADKDTGRIVPDSGTTLTGVPPSARDGGLGGRCAPGWILDQHEEKTPKDPTIREGSGTCRFTDGEENVVDLLMRVTTASVEARAMAEARHAARVMRCRVRIGRGIACVRVGGSTRAALGETLFLWQYNRQINVCGKEIS